MSTLMTDAPVLEHAAQLFTVAWCPACSTNADPAIAAQQLEPTCPTCSAQLELSTATEYTTQWAHIID